MNSTTLTQFLRDSATHTPHSPQSTQMPSAPHVSQQSLSVEGRQDPTSGQRLYYTPRDQIISDSTLEAPDAPRPSHRQITHIDDADIEHLALPKLPKCMTSLQAARTNNRRVKQVDETSGRSNAASTAVDAAYRLSLMARTA